MAGEMTGASHRHQQSASVSEQRDTKVVLQHWLISPATRVTKLCRQILHGLPRP